MASNSAHAEGRLKEAVAQRKAAADLLKHVPAGMAQFPVWVQQVAELFRESGLTRQSREIVQTALDRAEQVSGSPDNRRSLLTTMADFWGRDGNPLKALQCLEKVAAALEAAGLADPGNAELTKVLGYVSFGRQGFPIMQASQAISVYRALAEINRSLGRREAVAAMVAKIRALAKDHDVSLAELYEHLDLSSDAESLHRTRVDRAESPEDKADALVSLGEFYSRTQRFPEAAGALEQAVHLNPETGHGGLVEALDRAEPTEEGRRALRQAAERQGVASDQTFAGLIEFGISLEVPMTMAPDIGAEAAKAQSAADQGNFDDAFAQCLRLFEMASTADARAFVMGAVPELTGKLVEKGATKQTQQIYERALAMADEWSAVDAEPQMQITAEYVKFLIPQRDRWSDVPGAIERYRAMVSAAAGADSHAIEGVLELSLDFERKRESRTGSATAAREYLQLEESLSGTTSEAYLDAIQRVVGVVEFSGETVWELELRRKAVSVSDVLYGMAHEERAAIRLSAASALARSGRHEEAERMALEAAEIRKAARKF